MQGHPIDLDSGETKINGDVSRPETRFKRDSVSRQRYRRPYKRGKIFPPLEQRVASLNEINYVTKAKINSRN